MNSLSSAFVKISFLNIFVPKSYHENVIPSIRNQLKLDEFHLKNLKQKINIKKFNIAKTNSNFFIKFYIIKNLILFVEKVMNNGGEKL